MLSLFDPTLEPMEEPEEDPLKLIPLYRSPKVQAGVLPGKYGSIIVYNKTNTNMV